MGPVIEREWNPFTAKMIQRSNATVVPVFFPGANSRLYQIANQISATLRQGLLIREVVIAMNKPQAPIVRPEIARDEIKEWSGDPRGFMKWLREKTIGAA
jgi:putative hemolysin